MKYIDFIGTNASRSFSFYADLLSLFFVSFYLDYETPFVFPEFLT